MCRATVSSQWTSHGGSDAIAARSPGSGQVGLSEAPVTAASVEAEDVRGCASSACAHCNACGNPTECQHASRLRLRSKRPRLSSSHTDDHTRFTGTLQADHVGASGCASPMEVAATAGDVVHFLQKQVCNCAASIRALPRHLCLLSMTTQCEARDMSCYSWSCLTCTAGGRSVCGSI